MGIDVDSYSLRQPLGRLRRASTPFNFPAMVPMWMFPMALACGNTFILKPSERDPTLSLRMAELLKDAGLPDGVFNVVHGDKEAVDAILSIRDIKAVSFVGSDADREIHLRRPARARQARAGAGRREEPRRRAARPPISFAARSCSSGWRVDILAGDFVAVVVIGDERSRLRCCSQLAERARLWAPATSPNRRWARSSAPPHATPDDGPD